jgi:hypothetical protein
MMVGGRRPVSVAWQPCTTIRDRSRGRCEGRLAAAGGAEGDVCDGAHVWLAVVDHADVVRHSEDRMLEPAVLA